jgi:hypothetical protein
MQEAKDPGEYDQEGDMSMTQLRSIIYHAQELHDQLNKNDNLPEWVQSKITLAQDYVQTACDYMYSQKNEEVVQEKRGLWDNIHAKRQRIKNGSGESMRKPGSEGAPSAEDLKNSQKSQKKLPQGAEFAAARRKARLASNGRMDEEVAGWIAHYNGQKHEIKKHEAKDLWDAKQKAIAHFKAPKSKHGLIAIKPAYNEEVEQIEEAMSGGGYASFQKETGKIGYIGNKRGMIKHVKSNPDHIRGYTSPDRKVGDIFGGYPKKTVKEEHLEEGRPSQQHPLEGHEYHKKSNAELEYIAKDAHEAAEAMKSHGTESGRRAENKYRDQASDSATVRYFRKKSGMPDWYKKKYGHVKEDVVTEGYFSDMDADNKDKQYAGTKAYHANKNAKKAMDPPFTPDAPKKNLGVVVGKRPEGMSKARHLARLAMKGELNKKKTVKEDNAPDVEKTNTPAKRTVSKTTMIVKDAAKSSKEKNKDKFEAEPELSSQIVRNNF